MSQLPGHDATGKIRRGPLAVSRALGPSMSVNIRHAIFGAAARTCRVEVRHLGQDRSRTLTAAGGLNVVVFDNRCFGASDGEPRLEIDPWAQVRDYRHAITYAGTLPEVDPRRIGIWGSSYSGGHVLVVAAIDRRVRAVVSQVPLVSGHANQHALVRADFIAGSREQFDADHLARFRGEPPAMVPVVDKDPLAPSALPTPDSWEWFSETGRTRAPSWRNEVTLRSVEMFTEYEPGSYLPYISPTPCPCW